VSTPAGPEICGQVKELAEHSNHILLDSLRAVLRKFESDTGHDPQSVAELKQTLRARIAELEAAEALRSNARRSERPE